MLLESRRQQSRRTIQNQLTLIVKGMEPGLLLVLGLIHVPAPETMLAVEIVAAAGHITEAWAEAKRSMSAGKRK